MYADLSNPTEFDSHLSIKSLDGDRLEQTLSFDDGKISSTAKIEGNRLLFAETDFPTQVMLLPDGASCSCPLKVSSGHNFVLEMGWLLKPNIRQRIMRSYNEKGNWVSCTLVTEHRQ